MSHEIPSQQPDLLLDYYERHFLRTLGSYACADYGIINSESGTAHVLNLYEPNAENLAITDSFVRPPGSTVTDQLGLLASRARIWGDTTSQEIAAREIFAVGDSRGSDSNVSDKTIVRTLLVAGRPDIAHIKLKAYRGALGSSYRGLLCDVGKEYCDVAKSKEDLKVVPAIIDELEPDNHKSRKTIDRIRDFFKPTQTRIDETDKADKKLYKTLNAHLRYAHYRIEHPENFNYSVTKPDKDPYPYATAYREGGLSAAFGLYAYDNRASKEKSVFWPYQAVVEDLAKSGELSAASNVANEGLARVAQEYEDGAVPAFIHHHIVRHVINGYARAHDLERAHEMTTAIPDFDERDARVSARREAAREYIQGYVDELQPGDSIANHCLETVMDYVNQYVPDECERDATFLWIMDVLAPRGQVEAIKRIMTQLPPLESSPYQKGEWSLFAAHLVNKDYEACTEYLECWPNERLTIDALASVILEKRRRKAASEIV